jgi:hypothetical protein
MGEHPHFSGNIFNSSSLTTEEFPSLQAWENYLTGRRVSLPVRASFTVRKSFSPCISEFPHCPGEFPSLREFPFLYVKLPHSPGEPFLMGYLLTSRKSLPSRLKPSGPIRKEIICFLRNSKILFIS